MGYITLFICFLLLVFIIWYTKYKNDLLNPLVAFVIPLLMNIFLYYGLYQEEYKLTDRTLVIFFVGIFGYLFGVFIIECKSSSNRYMVGVPELKVNENVRNIILLIGTLGFFAGLYEMFTHGLMGPTNSFFTNVRINEIFNGGNHAFTKYSVVFLHIGVCIYEYQYFTKTRKSRKNFLYLLFFTMILLLSICFTMARTGLLQYSLSIIYIYLYAKNKANSTRKRRTLRTLIKENRQLLGMAVFLILVFIGIAQLTGRMTGSNSFFNKDFVLYRYLGYSLVTFDKYILGHGGITNGFYVFGPFGKILEMMHLIDISEVEKIGASMNEFNVYSYISAPYMDFGIVGLFLTMIVIGSIVAFVYNLSLRKGGFFTIFYAIYLYSIVIAFFAYQFSNTYYIYIIVLMLLLKLNIRRVRFYGLRRKSYSACNLLQFSTNNKRNIE